MKPKYLIMRQIAPFLKDLLFPRRCVSCGKIDTFLCDKCASMMLSVSSHKCLFCKKMIDGQICDSCKKEFRVKNAYVSVYYREGPARDLIVNLKFKGKKEIAGLMGTMVAEKMLQSWRVRPFRGSNPFKDYVLVPVPLDKRRKNERGFNQSELLARELGRSLGLEVRKILGKRLRAPQMGLNRKERQQNLKGAFYGISKPPKKVLLVDDVLTTGATVKECTRVLKENGAREVAVAVFARD
ncbi:TPA: ComF family protein [candidate division CPR2 bacterium]|uniref:Phosphoribosyltransferase n=1 Tax=candidate division CPR2 bacterium GW2011_GWC1_41_48 TaxID=1618344 RepID=A0A0G0WBG4_UNCC2|nr:MAG: Phosphoribosyltransferase [candidate division CPR2 bacterium GW2011_GWC2_39_35]KKR27696.1 MAG: Phosphoribosyltransferase [candidate division CPR2 bacterium GW2011_GWD2_39_7]KKS09407.1 MAG: Phosphoribosyltransferase [candidate division CPR2 bacterium GW2011_GWC1_41_48]HBG82162.1 ComF family protein [candidate division CPR2 bacterium]